ncbi:unnamed protein product [Acanthoscelides obtectus]|nr:unnamed protein product [Acanthoscelides obtectus]CAK1670748.1 Ethanolaminephosphotransferase 1 [Acanthoscelides obtectus]
MSHTRCEIFNCLLIPTSVVVGIAVVTRLQTLELFLTYALCVVATLTHLHYGTSVVRQMCKHFKVNCFTLKDRTD